jgi:hypothetical protein
LVQDGVASSFGLVRKLKLERVFAKTELNLWARIEKIKYEKLSNSYIDNAYNILSWWNCGGGCSTLKDASSRELFLSGNFKRVLLLNHPHEYMDLLIQYGRHFDLIITEAYFTKELLDFLGLDFLKVIEIPYFPLPKFRALCSFDERISKLLVVGSIVKQPDNEALCKYKEIFGSLFLHSQRIEILQALHAKSLVDIHMAVDQSAINVDLYNQGERPDVYFSHKIENLYNSYKLFHVSGENLGVPPVAFYEGIQCGAVFFGRSDRWLRELGFIEYQDFIPWKGASTDISEEVHNALENYDLRNISENAILKLTKMNSASFSKLIKIFT